MSVVLALFVVKLFFALFLGESISVAVYVFFFSPASEETVAIFFFVVVAGLVLISRDCPHSVKKVTSLQPGGISKQQKEIFFSCFGCTKKIEEKRHCYVKQTAVA